MSKISINGLPISDQDLETYLYLYQDLLEKTVLNQTLLGLTEFELMTVLAFDYLQQKSQMWSFWKWAWGPSR